MRRALALGWLLFWLAGCATVTVAPKPLQTADLNRFALVGRLAVRQGEQRHHVRIDWRHAPETDQILLTTPFGQGLAEIVRDARGARLTLADRRQYTADDLNALSRNLFGFALPLDAAARWLAGETGMIEGWRLAVLARQDTAPALPTTIEFERDDISATLRIDDWLEAP